MSSSTVDAAIRALSGSLAGAGDLIQAAARSSDDLSARVSALVLRECQSVRETLESELVARDDALREARQALADATFKIANDEREAVSAAATILRLEQDVAEFRKVSRVVAIEKENASLRTQLEDARAQLRRKPVVQPPTSQASVEADARISSMLAQLEAARGDASRAHEDAERAHEDAMEAREDAARAREDAERAREDAARTAISLERAEAAEAAAREELSIVTQALRSVKTKK